MKDNTVPLKLIALLANGEFHSGEQLGETLGLSPSSYLMLNRYWVSWMAVV